jgi:ABC-2 type transport system permease protein
MNRVWLIVRKEWREVFKDKLILLTSLLVPVLFVAMTVGTIYFMERSPEVSGSSGDLGLSELMLLPQFAGISEALVFQILLVNQYLFYYLMIPLMIPLFVAVYSIIGEKQQRTLEPLLASPVAVWEILVGKTLAGVIPAVIITWISYVLTVVLCLVVAQPEVVAVMVGPIWLLAVLLLAPLLSVMAVLVGVIISSRVNDVRLAEQIGGMLVLPLVGLSVPVLMGKLLLSGELIMAGCAGVALLDVGLLYLGTKLFQRETILTRWK